MIRLAPGEQILAQDTYGEYTDINGDSHQNIKIYVTNVRLHITGVKVEGLIFQRKTPSILVNIPLSLILECRYRQQWGLLYPGILKITMKNQPHPVVLETHYPEFLASAIRRAQSEIQRAEKARASTGGDKK